LKIDDEKLDKFPSYWGKTKFIKARTKTLVLGLSSRKIYPQKPMSTAKNKPGVDHIWVDVLKADISISTVNEQRKRLVY
jgi:hypothetical protein